MSASLASLFSSAKAGARPLFNSHGSHRLPPWSLLPFTSSVSCSLLLKQHWNHQIGKCIKTSCSRRLWSLNNIYALQTSDGDGADDEACELVNGVEVSVNGVEAYLLTAVKNNNGTGLLLLSDVFGFQDSSTRDFAYRIACNGYNVLVPDLFRGDPWSKNRPESEYEEWRKAQDPNRIRQDTTSFTKWMIEEFAAAGISKKLGVMGFCFGGGHVVNVLADDENGYFSTGVSFYGTRIDSAVVAGDVKAPVLFIAGNRDQLCKVEGLFEIEKKIGHGSKVVVFEGRGHGFVHRPQTPEDDRDAEEAFVVLRNWLHHHLLSDH